MAPANPANLWLDELENEGGPQMQHRAEPMGAHLALLAALYDDGVRAVAARGGLAGYLSVLENAFAYVPFEDILLGVLRAGDIADLAAALAPRPLALLGLVDGRNIPLGPGALERTMEPVRAAYRSAGVPERFAITMEPRELAAWFEARLK